MIRIRFDSLEFVESNKFVNSLGALTPCSSNVPANSFLAWRASQRAKPDVTDEYTRYISTPAIAVTGLAYKWWLEPQQQQDYPYLSRMALDLLSIPAMSADPERLFSSAGQTITKRRNRLTINMIQAIECLKSWMGIQEWKEDDEVSYEQEYGFKVPEGEPTATSTATMTID